MAVHKWLLLLAVIALAFCSTFSAAEGGAAATYKAKCAMCHGTDGKGDTPAGKKMGAHDFGSPEVQGQTDEQLAEITAKGKNKMPAYGKSLKESEIKDLVAYVRELGKKK